jgi:hypothetical protein
MAVSRLNRITAVGESGRNVSQAADMVGRKAFREAWLTKRRLSNGSMVFHVEDTHFTRHIPAHDLQP